jgi:hypothetical protein
MKKLKYIKYFIHTLVLNNAIICRRFCMEVSPPQSGGRVTNQSLPTVFYLKYYIK